MRIVHVILFLLFTTLSFGQKNGPLSTMDFVQIINDNREETLFYYNNNWKKLREEAIKKEYILSYQLLDVEATEDAPFDIILITTYIDKEQYDKREEHFSELIEARGPVRLLNDKKPGDFRKILFNKDPVKHIF